MFGHVRNQPQPWAITGVWLQRPNHTLILAGSEAMPLATNDHGTSHTLKPGTQGANVYNPQHLLSPLPRHDSAN